MIFRLFLVFWCCISLFLFSPKLFAFFYIGEVSSLDDKGKYQYIVPVYFRVEDPYSTIQVDWAGAGSFIKEVRYSEIKEIDDGIHFVLNMGKRIMDDQKLSLYISYKEHSEKHFVTLPKMQEKVIVDGKVLSVEELARKRAEEKRQRWVDCGGSEFVIGSLFLNVFRILEDCTVGYSIGDWPDQERDYIDFFIDRQFFVGNSLAEVLEYIQEEFSFVNKKDDSVREINFYEIGEVQ